MSRPTLDAAALAARMNARPLPEDCDGGVWEAGTLDITQCCDVCERVIMSGTEFVASDTHTLCLPCALADCERAEADHRAANPHCTCNDCMAHTIATTERTD